MTHDYAGLLHALLPELALVAGALVVLGFDLATARRSSEADRRFAAAGLGSLAVAAAIAHSWRAGGTRSPERPSRGPKPR